MTGSSATGSDGTVESAAAASGAAGGATPGSATQGDLGAPPLIVDEGGAPTAVANGEKCIEVVQGFEGATPTVLILVDQSASMNEVFDQGLTRWQAVRDTLLDSVDGVVTQLQGSVRFGLSIYTSITPNQPPEGFVADNFEGGCPLLLNSSIGLNNLAEMDQMYPPGGVGHTPTGESLQAATETLLVDASPGPRAIVLATDGDPDNCMDGNANTPNNLEGQILSKQLSVDAVKTAFGEGIKTYVISVGFDATLEHLQELAETGQGSPEAVPYSANTATELRQAFSDIVGGVRSCSFTLHGEVPDFHAPMGEVSINGQPLTLNDSNGWVLANANTVELQGAACEAVLTTDAVVNISFPCVPEFKLAK